LSRADFIYQFTFIITISRMRSGFLSCALPAFGGRALLPFCFSQISGGVFVIPKTKDCFSPAGFVPVWFGCKNT
jgi:hypothetical protein